MRPNMLSTQLGGIANLALLAEIRPGFIEGFETVTYHKRLELLLRTLNAIRLASRESALAKSPFPDLIGRVGILHSFRYAIVPPEAAASSPSAVADAPRPGVYRLSLNVTFDGGWEPYMRVIYRDLGTLLDAIFCNCVGYRASRSHSFDEYTRWVRDHETGAGLFYTESAMTVLDQRYLEGIEKIHRQEPDAAKADIASAGFALQEPPSIEQILASFPNDEAKVTAVVAASRPVLRALKSLHELTPVFPRNTDEDDQYLLLFAQRALREFVGLLGTPLALKPAVSELLEPFERAITWIKATPTEVNLPQRTLAYRASKVQAGIVSGYQGITHGCLVLLSVVDAAAARNFLATLPVSVEGASCSAAPYCNVAFTLPGLKALGVPGWQIDLFPQEFIEGMETRAGLLGDVRTNHPNAWRRPILHGTQATEIELASVHVVVQFRLKDESTPGHALHLGFKPETDRFVSASGLAILSIEAMRSHPEKGASSSREHFGFQDGFSQPEVVDPNRGTPESTFWKNAVARGEILLGYPNDRHDGPCPTLENRLLDDGCFLVLRKIRQRVDVLDAVLKENPALPDLKQKMMGRGLDGEPLAVKSITPDSKTDFNYADDPNGMRCPFHSHARRSNPRHGTDIPRIIRRGMSYGPRDDTDRTTPRGVYFMAYCASIAEQFEVIQRWVAGGNSSGVASAQSDPLMGVPQPGDPRVYRYFNADKQVVRVKLGDKPFTELQWGAYLFVPSVGALTGLQSIVDETERPATQTPPSLAHGGGDGFKAWQRVIEDPNERERAWTQVMAANLDTPTTGTLPTGYGLLIADAAKVDEVLRDPGGRYSVRGYGRRLTQTVGVGYLGLDPDDGHTAQAETPRDSGVNQAIASISAEEAFRQAVYITTAVLAGFKHSTGQKISDSRYETPVDIVLLSEQVLGRLCRVWFGLPDADDKFMVLGGRTTERTGKPRCPGHFFSVARYVFWPHPSPTVAGDAQAHGKAIRQSVKDFLKAAPMDPVKREATLGKLSFAIESCLTKGKGDGTDDLVARTIAGTMLGFPPTVHGNFVRVMRAWLQTGANPAQPQPVTSLWTLQAQVLAHGTEPDYAVAEQVLRDKLLAQMRKSPVPEVIWREDPNASVGLKGEEPPKVVLGLVAAVQQPGAERLMFGGERTTNGAAPADAPQAVHACPGYEMAVGVMLGMVTALVLAGSVRPTASPTIVELVTVPEPVPAPVPVT